MNFVLKKGGADNFLYFGKSHTQNIYFDFYFGDQNEETNRFIVTLEETQDSLYIRSIDTAFFNGQWHKHNYEKNKIESQFSDINKGQAYYVNDRLKEFDVYHFHDTSDSSPIKGKCNIDDNNFLKRDGSNIAAFLYFLKKKHPNYFLRIEKTIQTIAPFFEKFVLAPNKLNENQIQWNGEKRLSRHIF